MSCHVIGSQSSAQYSEMKPDASALHGILRRIAEVRSNLHDIHSIADRACGSSGLGQTTAPKAVPNGLLSEIEEAMDGLMSSSAEAVARLSRVA
jgi:hypothetical protein